MANATTIYASLAPLARQQDRTRVRLGIIGFGAFGQLIASQLSNLFELYAYDPVSTKRRNTNSHGVVFASLRDVASCPIVVLAMPVAATAEVVAAIKPHVRPGTLVLDVGSVKLLPADVMDKGLPPDVHIVATHPLFGPQSARGGLAGLKIAICPVRGSKVGSVATFLRKRLGLQVIVTTPEEHDRQAATVQGLTHLLAKVLVRMEPLPQSMTTRSFDLIMQAVGMVRYDAPEVFEAIEKMNPFVDAVRERFFALALDLAEQMSPINTPQVISHNLAELCHSEEICSSGRTH